MLDLSNLVVRNSGRTIEGERYAPVTEEREWALMGTFGFQTLNTQAGPNYSLDNFIQEVSSSSLSNHEDYLKKYIQEREGGQTKWALNII